MTAAAEHFPAAHGGPRRGVWVDADRGMVEIRAGWWRLHTVLDNVAHAAPASPGRVSIRLHRAVRGPWRLRCRRVTVSVAHPDRVADRLTGGTGPVADRSARRAPTDRD